MNKELQCPSCVILFSIRSAVPGTSTGTCNVFKITSLAIINHIFLDNLTGHCIPYSWTYSWNRIFAPAPYTNKVPYSFMACKSRGSKWAIPFFVCTPPMEGLGIPAGFFLRTPMEGSGFFILNYDTIHRCLGIPAGFFPKIWYGRVWILEFQLDFLIMISSIGYFHGFFSQQGGPSIGNSMEFFFKQGDLP